MIDCFSFSVKFCGIILNRKIYLRMPFYAVAKGVVPGIYSTWSECQKQINGFKGPQFKKFDTEEDAQKFIQQKANNTIDNRKKVSPTLKDVENGIKKSESTVGSKGMNKIDYSSLSPELKDMHKKLKQQQKDLSLLRDKFDQYVAANYAQWASSDSSRKRSLSPECASSGHKKRLLDSDEQEGVTRDSEGRVEVFTDGCCEMNGRHGARAGIGAYFGHDSPLNISEPVVGRATNNTAEIQAITKTLTMVKSKGITEVVIKTDSQFTINCITQWMDGWKKRGWKKADGTEVVNKADLIELDDAQQGMLVSYVHVKGHSGIAGNEKADQLAKQGAARYVQPVAE